jgi:hypothetical protein
VRDSVKTKIKLLRPEEVWHPKRGGRPGNRNALKTGQHTGRNRVLRRQITAFIRNARAIAAMVEGRVKARGRVEAKP